ncbi:MAG: hypothetical protein ACT4R6_07410 [Gemmatimonadaceae bacterium]
MPFRSQISLLFSLAVLACGERSQPAQLEPPDVRPDRVIAYLAVTQSDGARDEYVVRAVVRHGAAVEEPASFVAALRSAGGRLTYVGEIADAGMLRAIAPSDTVIRVAGASSEGIRGGELFALRLRVARASELAALRLELSDLNDRSGASIRRSLTVLPPVITRAAL